MARSISTGLRSDIWHDVRCRGLTVAVSCLVAILIGLSAATGARADAWAEVATFGNWTVMRSHAATSTQTQCLAVHQRYAAIRLFNDQLQIVVPETPRGYQYQIDSGAASKLHLASQSEQENAMVSLAGSLLTNLASSERVKVEILTYSKILEVDLDLDGIDDALAYLDGAPSCQS